MADAYFKKVGFGYRGMPEVAMSTRYRVAGIACARRCAVALRGRRCLV